MLLTDNNTIVNYNTERDVGYNGDYNSSLDISYIQGNENTLVIQGSNNELLYGGSSGFSAVSLNGGS